jgi:hypothetical protein
VQASLRSTQREASAQVREVRQSPCSNSLREGDHRQVSMARNIRHHARSADAARNSVQGIRARPVAARWRLGRRRRRRPRYAGSERMRRLPAPARRTMEPVATDPEIDRTGTICRLFWCHPLRGSSRGQRCRFRQPTWPSVPSGNVRRAVQRVHSPEEEPRWTAQKGGIPEIGAWLDSSLCRSMAQAILPYLSAFQGMGPRPVWPDTCIVSYPSSRCGVVGDTKHARRTLQLFSNAMHIRLSII